MSERAHGGALRPSISFVFVIVNQSERSLQNHSSASSFLMLKVVFPVDRPPSSTRMRIDWVDVVYAMIRASHASIPLSSNR